MLSFDIRSLETQAAQVDTHLTADDPIWEEGDNHPSAPIHVEGRLSAAGGSRFYFSGRISSAVQLPCRRCLTDVTVPATEEVQYIFAETGDEEADDPDVYHFDPHARDLDLRPAVRESWLLVAPPYAQCREDCQGLCATCGIDLNTGSCGCKPVTIDNRWDALRKLRTES